MIWIVLLAGTILRLVGLGSRPFDGDEGTILKAASQSNIKEVISQASRDAHPVGFATLEHFFVKFDLNEWTARILPLLAGILLIYFVFIFAKKHFSDLPAGRQGKIAIMAALLIALSPYLLYFSQEARMYSLFAVATLATIYYFFMLPKKKARYKFGFLAAGLTMVYLHHLGWIILFSLLIYSLIWHWRPFWRNFIGFLAIFMLILFLYLPTLPLTIKQIKGRLREQPAQLSIKQNAVGIVGAVYRFGAGRTYLDLKQAPVQQPLKCLGFFATLLIPLALAVWGLVLSWKKYRQITIFILFFSAISILVALVSSEIGSRASRYLIYLSPFYYIFIATALSSGKFLQRYLLTAAILAIFAVGIYFNFSRDVRAPGANEIAKYIAKNGEGNQVVLIRGAFGGGEGFVFDFYCKLQAASCQLPVEDMYGNYQVGNLAELKKVKPFDKIADLQKDYSTIWFYDLTYLSGENDFSVKPYNLGQDKEQKDLLLWELTSK